MFIPWFTRNSKVSLVLCWPIPESKFNRLTLGIAGASAIDTAMVFGPTTSMTDFIRRTLSWGPWSQVTDAFLIGELMGPLWYGKGERNWSRWWYNYDGTLAFNDIQGTMVLPITAVSWCVVLHITAESDICHHSPVTRQVTSAVWFEEIKALPVHFNLVFSHLEFRQLEEDTRLHMAGVNGEITWGKPVCEHLMVWLYWLYWFMKACAEISHQGCVQRMLYRHAKENRHQIRELKSLISHLLCLSFSRTVRSHSTCYGKAMKRTALNSDSGLGVTFQPKNGRFLGSRLGGMAKFASICPNVFLYDYVWVWFKLDGALLELSSPRMVWRTNWPIPMR